MANQKFNITFDANLNISQMKSALGEIQGSFAKLHLPQNVGKGLQEIFQKLNQEIKNFEELSSKKINTKSDYGKLEKSLETIFSLYEKLERTYKNLSGLSGKDLEKLFPETVAKNINNARQALENYNKELKKVRNNVTNQDKKVTGIEEKIEAEKSKKVDSERYKELTKSIREANTEIEKLKKSEIEAQKAIDDKRSSLKDPDKHPGKILPGLEENLRNIQKQLDEAIRKRDQLIAEKKVTTTESQQSKELQELNQQLEEAKQKLADFKAQQAQLESTTDGGGLQQLVQTIGELLGLDLTKFTGDSKELGEVIEKYLIEKIGQTQQGFNNVIQPLETFGRAVKETGDKVRKTGEETEEMNERMRDVQALKSRIQYFFGLNNAINLVKRAIRGAYQTISELDKAMTATAVVTDFTVSDMWSQLPEYTKQANELGVSTLAAYEAATLYYQQGLKTNEVTALSTETLKMARIAGLDAAEATDRMTNALRGFNMELNETSAQRVDDVYSQLAARTASNVDEISTAMTKVASLANNANMQFETTAAFLAQIIETTRESAETAGTALKTVVARFSEVKKLVSEDQLRGTDEEGEAINVNKVSEALRTAGIDLNKYFLGEVGLDDIFMELASKWDSLTKVQQRYIATQAAGSRQQSRFIALMSNYKRTQELVGEAYNANGAAAKQFEKTQDSLESKVARLKNAWNEFLMGLTNNDIVKGAIDLLTKLLNTVNSLTDAFGDNLGSVAKWLLVIAGFKGLKGLFSSGGIIEKVLALSTKGTIFSGLTGKLAEGAAQTVPAKVGFIEGFSNFGANLTKSKLLGSAARKGMKAGINSNLAGGFMSSTATTTAGGVSAGLAGLGAALGYVAIAVGAVIAAYKLWLTFSLKGQLKDAQEYAKTMEKLAKDTKDTADSMSDAIKKSREYSKAINEATNNKQRNDVIKDRNEYIISLLEENEKFGEYVRTTFENGELVLTLDEDALAAAADKAAEVAVKASIGSSFAQATMKGRQASVLSGGLSSSELEKIYNLEENTITMGNITRQMTSEERTNYILNRQKIDSELKQMQQYAQNAFAQMVDAKALGDEVAELASEALAQGFDSTNLKTSAWSWIQPRSYWQGEYLSKYGTEADSTMKTKDIARAVRQAEINEAEQKRVDLLNSLLTGVNRETYVDLLNSFLQKSTFDNFNLTSLFATGNELDIYSKLFGIKNTEDIANYLVQLAEALGTNTDAIREQIKNNVANQRKQQGQVLLNAAGQMYGIQGAKAQENIEKLFNLNNFADQQIVANLIDTFKNSEVGSTIIDQLIESIDNGELNEEVSDWVSKLDFSNATATYKELQSVIGSDNTINENIKAIANAILNSQYAEENFSDVARLNNFLLSSSYEELEEELDKFIEENGSISSENIEELAESNEALNELLKDNTISAKALAVAITGIKTGKIVFTDLNKDILSALNSMDDLDHIVKNTIDDLNSFDAGYDENEIASNIKNIYEKALENIQKGAIGNNQMRNQLEYIFGVFSYDPSQGSYDQAYTKWLDERVKWLEENQENMYSAWSEFIGNEEKLIVEFDNKSAEILKEGNEIVIKANNMTTEELIKAMAETNNVTEQQAAMMISDFKNYSADFAAMMAENDIDRIINTWIDSIYQNGEGRTFYLDKDLENLAKLLDKPIDQIKAKFEELGGSIKLSEIKWSEGTVEDIQRILDETGHGDYINSDYIQTGWDTWIKDAVDYNALKEQMIQAGLSEYFDMVISSIAEDANASIITHVGDSVEQIIRQDGESIQEAYERTVQEAQNIEFANTIGQAVAEALSGIEIGVETDEATGKIVAFVQSITDELNEIPLTVIQVDDSQLSQAENKVNELNDAIQKLNSQISGTSNQNNNTQNRRTQAQKTAAFLTNASGGKITDNIFALTGEEGAEIVWNKNKGYAYITGGKGPEFKNLQSGDRVFNAQDTQKIIKRSGFKSFANTLDEAHAYNLVDKNKNAGGLGDTKEDWKERLDWLYNLMEDIAELERQQTILSEKYENTLKDVNATGRDLYNITKEQIANLQTQRDNYEEAARRRRQEMQERVTNSGYTDYVWWNNQDQTVEIDWDKINSVTDKDTYDQIKELISTADQIQSQIDDAEDNLREIDVSIKELYDRQLKTFTDFQSRVLDAVVNKYQQQIDNLSDLNDTLTDTNSAILNSIRKEIDLQRQIRDNTETENSIRDLENRIAYLRRDTTGGNAQQIRELEKQLEEQTLSYGDQLIDQELERLNEKNDEAAEQRDKQIELMTASLDYQKRNGEFWPEVMDLINGGIGPNGTLVSNSKLVEILQQAEGWDALSIEQRKIWADELNETAHAVGEYLITIREGIDSISQGVWANIPSTSIGSAGGGSSSGGTTPSGLKTIETPDTTQTQWKPVGTSKLSGGGIINNESWQKHANEKAWQLADDYLQFDSSTLKVAEYQNGNNYDNSQSTFNVTIEANIDNSYAWQEALADAEEALYNQYAKYHAMGQGGGGKASTFGSGGGRF